MKLTVLGCSGTLPGPDSPASGYLVEEDGYRLVLDLGHGALGPLQRYVAPHEVDAIVLSHLHGDHCIDLTAYVNLLRFGPHRLTGRIPVIGPSGTRDRIETAYNPLARKLALQELFDFSTPRSGELGPFAVSVAAVNHPVPAYAIRLSVGDRTLVYSGDTGESEALVSLAHGADVLLCEASIAADEEYVPDLHLTGKQAGEHAAKAGIDRLIVTHVPPWNSREDAVAEAATAFTGSVEAAQPGAEYWI
ncbi:MAG TPA: MBL fold metallo-hydrolase [Jatrophihabitantaceae bacterium]|jgi:ribonuclease BN (tRNA processing enzyme)